MRVHEITQIFQTLSRRHDTASLFKDFCQTAAIALANKVDKRQYARREKLYLDIVGQYKQDKEVVLAFCDILGEVALSLADTPADVLGPVFHQLELHNRFKGQFFTPHPLCAFMAHMLVGTKADTNLLLKQHGFLRALEPTCGSGAMIIALAETLKDIDINYHEQLHVTAIDIDPKCIHIAYIQLSLLGIPAVLIHGNSLNPRDIRELWYTPAHIIGGWSRRLATLDDQDACTEAVIRTPSTRPSPTTLRFTTKQLELQNKR